MIAVVRHVQNYGSLKDHLAAFLFLFAGVIYCAWSLVNESRKSPRPLSIGRGRGDGCRSIAIWPPHRGGSAHSTADQLRRGQPQPSHYLKERT